MNETAPLTGTLSIAEGMSVGTVMTDVAAVYGIHLSPETTSLLQDINHLYSHIDSRLDRDKPNSVPDPAAQPGEELPWAHYLSFLTDPGDLEQPDHAGQLTTEQVGAFIGLRSRLAALDLPETERQRLGQGLRHSFHNWILASQYVKTADHPSGSGGYVRSREWENRALSRIFLNALPDEVKAQRGYGRFETTLQRLVVAQKLTDSLSDIGEDMRTGNSALRSKRLGKLAVVGGGAVVGMQLLPALVRHPALVPKIIGKAVVTRRNADGRLNAERIHE